MMDVTFSWRLQAPMMRCISPASPYSVFSGRVRPPVPFTKVGSYNARVSIVKNAIESGYSHVVEESLAAIFVDLACKVYSLVSSEWKRISQVKTQCPVETLV